MIQEPMPFSREWWSHKFNGAGLRYEVAICIQTGDIVWVNGPYPPARHQDISIFRHLLKGMLGEHEKVVADSGYDGDWQCCTPKKARSRRHFVEMSVARDRHETVNRKLKYWQALKHEFRHNLQQHHIVFRSVATLTQIAIEHGHGPFQVDYRRDHFYVEPDE